MNTLLQDLRYASRTLAKNKVVTAAIVLTLALGIGATTAIFSVVDTVLLSPLPYDDPGRIYRIRAIDPRGLAVAPVMQAHIDPLNESEGSVLAAAYGFADDATVVSGGGLPFAVSEYFVSEPFFRIFTYPLALGRAFEPGDDYGATVLSYETWRDIFDSDPDIVGAVVDVDGGARMVLGVAAPGFELPAGAAMWTMFGLGGQASDVLQMDAYVRLDPGASAGQLAAELDVLSARLDPWQDGRPVRLVAIPLLDDVVGDFSGTVLVLSGAVGILLLIACLNVAMLLFTRIAAREREMALRGALGAGRWRTVRQLLTETTVLAALGGALGLGLAAAAVQLAGAIGFAGLPRLEALSIDLDVLLFAVACSAITAFAVGLAPALKQARGDLTLLINDGGRSVSGGRGRNRLFGTLIVAEMALAVVLAIGAGLLVRNYVALLSEDPGFDPARLVTVELNVPGRVDLAARESYLPVANFYDELIERIAALPGVESASATSHMPLVPPVAGAPFLEPGEPFEPGSTTPIRQTQATQVTPGFFGSMGVEPVSGRMFAPTDRRDAAAVALVNEAFARFVYGAGDAVGQRVIFPGAPLWAPGGLAYRVGEMAAGEFEIVGVVPDIPQTALWETPEPAVYIPHEQWTVRRMTVVVRAALDPGTLIAPIRAALAEMDATIAPAFTVYSDVLSGAVARQRLGASLLSAFGLASLVLTAVGIYGLMSYSVTQRSSEIALRSALGARPREIRAMVVARTLRLALGGIALGLAAAWAARSIVASQLHEISALDPLVFALVPAAMLALAVVSAYLPARRASGIDPARTLRAD